MVDVKALIHIIASNSPEVASAWDPLDLGLGSPQPHRVLQCLLLGPETEEEKKRKLNKLSIYFYQTFYLKI